jgi:hypothetical protein
MSPTYCPLAWTSVNFHDNRASPCCGWLGEGTKVASVADALTSQLFIQTRSNMLTGKESHGCAQCYQEESLGISSRRMHALAQVGVTTNIKLRSLDISFDNICNLKCRGCVSSNSHLIRNDEIEIYGESFSETKYWQNNIPVDVSNLEEINIAGREPFLSKNFKNFSNALLFLVKSFLQYKKK